MRLASTTNHTFLTLRDEYGRIMNGNILIVSKPGTGKTLATEGIAEKFQKNGYTVIIASDPKNELEFAFQMFEPEKNQSSSEYHLKHLNIIGKSPGRQDIKIYHPFSFTLDNKPLPKINFFTVPLKDLGKHEWSLIAETGSENEAVSLLLKATEEINDNDGLYGFMHYISDSITGKSEKKRKKADPKNFYLPVGSGTAKELSRITNYMQPFKKHYFLGKRNSPYNLNWKELLKDNKHYHVFSTKFMDKSKDEKTMQFITLYILESIIRTLNDSAETIKTKILIIFPEIRKQCPFTKLEGYKLFLALAIKNGMTTVRSVGRGVTTLSDSQVWGDIDKDIRNSATMTLLGELSADDIEELGKKWTIKKEIKEHLKKPKKKNTFIWIDSDEDEPIYLFLPKAIHKEEQYNFFEMYKWHNQLQPEEYPMVKYDKLIKDMKDSYREEEKKFKDKANKKEFAEEQMELEKQAEKEIKKTEATGIESKEKKIKELQNKTKEQVMKLCYDMYMDESIPKSERSYRKIGLKFGKNKKTAKDYIDNYAKKLEQDNSKSYEDKFVEENNKTETEGEEENEKMS